MNVCPKGAITEAERIASEDPNALIPQQFQNPANPEIHREVAATFTILLEKHGLL